jgi:hypothetical protein
MRPGSQLAVGLIAAVGALSLAATAAAQEAPGRRMAPPIQTHAGPDVKFRGCIYYEHDNWVGDKRTITAGTRRKFVGDKWNEKISSVACNPYCHIVAYQNRDFQGDQIEFGYNTQAVGEQWNDQISSIVARCRRAW